MSGNRNRPQFGTSIDPAVHAYLSQDHVNAGGLIDHAVRQTVNHQKLKEAAKAAGVVEQSKFDLGLPPVDRQSQSEPEDLDE